MANLSERLPVSDSPDVAEAFQAIVDGGDSTVTQVFRLLVSEALAARQANR
jgi:hypothetical protein